MSLSFCRSPKCPCTPMSCKDDQLATPAVLSSFGTMFAGGAREGRESAS